MNIVLVGYGKMGRAIEKLALDKGHTILLSIHSANQAALTRESLQRADVAIEFSRPSSAFKNIKTCLEAGCPVISGTTGWLDQLDTIKAICLQERSAFLYASNFSIGVNIFFAINALLAKLMDQQTQYEPSIEEIHHTQKLDAPSGTAITLAEQIIAQLAHKSQWQQEEATAANAIAIQSKRLDQVPGTHHIRWASDIDTIEVKHTAHSREGFAKGALQAAEWLVGKQGVFEMKDVLGFG